MRLSTDFRVFASDAFQGRAPGTAGEERTVAWLIEQLKATGVQPRGPGGQWTQTVPLLRTQLGAGTVSVGGTSWQ